MFAYLTAYISFQSFVFALTPINIPFHCIIESNRYWKAIFVKQNELEDSDVVFIAVSKRLASVLSRLFLVQNIPNIIELIFSTSIIKNFVQIW